MPVLVCRRAHYLTTLMARQLGFYVLQTHRQYVRPHLIETDDSRRHLEEVNAELAYDLVPHGESVPQMVEHFRRQLQAAATRTAERWAVTAPAAGQAFEILRNDALNYGERAQAMQELAEITGEAHAEPMEWAAAAP